MKVRYEEMLPSEFKQAIASMPVAIVPTGLLEWHGDHLPLGLDALKAYGICIKIAEKIGGGVVLPPNYYGRPGFSKYTGTLTYSDACITLLFAELFGQLKKVGAKVIVLLTGHYGSLQVDCVKRIAEQFMIENPDVTVIALPEYEGVTVDGAVPADHAGKWETSMLMYLRPDLVKMDQFMPGTVHPVEYGNPPNNYYNEPNMWVWSEDLRNTASPELGEKAVNTIVEAVAERIFLALKAHAAGN
ncbi:MAG TPA: creatininase family protein [Clostridia bacterium]|nr:creatininase family protein [Clostridia bacterium]